MLITLARRFVRLLSGQPPFKLSLQSDETECGLACLAMIFSFYKIPASLEDLRSFYGSTRGGLTVGTLCKLSNHYGVRAIASRSDITTTTSFPAVIFVRNEHFSVVWKADDRFYYVADPADGSLVLSHSDFKEYYSGILITFNLFPSISNSPQEERDKSENLQLRDLLLSKSTALNVSIILAISFSVLAVMNASFQDVFMTYVVEEGENSWIQPLIYLVVICSITSASCSFLMQVSLQRQLQSAVQTWNIALFESLFNAPYRFFINKTSGLIVSRFNQLEEALSAYQDAVIQSFTGLLNLSIFFFVVILTSPVLALVSLLLCGLFISVGVLFYGFNIQNSYLLREAQCTQATAEFKLITQRSQIIIEHSEQAMRREFGMSYLGIASAELKMQRIAAINEFCLSIIDILLSCCLLGVSALLIIDGSLTTGTYAAINVLVGTALEPVRNLSTLVNQLQNSRLTFASASDLYHPKVLSSMDESNITTTASSEQPPLIELENVTFSYSLYDKPLLDKLSLRVKSPSGKSLAVRLDGSAASGKTTVCNLLLGMLVPNEGSVRVCGKDISLMQTNAKKSLVQFVSRSSYIVYGSVEHNCLLSSGSDRGAFQQVLEALSLDRQPLFTQQSSRVIHNDQSISTGQAVMVSLVRAALYRPSLLIIDEALVSIPEHLHEKIVAGFLSLGISLLIVQCGTSSAISSLPTISMAKLVPTSI